MPSLLDHLRTVAATYSRARDRSHSRVSTIVFGSGNKLPAIMRGEADLSTGNYERAMRWFSANWPDDEPWPTDIPRPAPAPSTGAPLAGDAPRASPASSVSGEAA